MPVQSAQGWVQMGIFGLISAWKGRMGGLGSPSGVSREGGGTELWAGIRVWVWCSWRVFQPQLSWDSGILSSHKAMESAFWISPVQSQHNPNTEHHPSVKNLHFYLRQIQFPFCFYCPNSWGMLLCGLIKLLCGLIPCRKL